MKKRIKGGLATDPTFAMPIDLPLPQKPKHTHKWQAVERRYVAPMPTSFGLIKGAPPTILFACLCGKTKSVKEK